MNDIKIGDLVKIDNVLVTKKLIGIVVFTTHLYCRINSFTKLKYCHLRLKEEVEKLA